MIYKRKCTLKDIPQKARSPLFKKYHAPESQDVYFVKNDHQILWIVSFIELSDGCIKPISSALPGYESDRDEFINLQMRLNGEPTYDASLPE